MQESIAFLVRVQCRRKESSRSLSHLLMSFLLSQLVETRLANSIIGQQLSVLASLSVNRGGAETVLPPSESE